MTERHIASVFPANPQSVDDMIRDFAEQRERAGYADPGPTDDGWSAPVWVRLANSDLILGSFPLGPTYEALEPVVENDWARAEAGGEISVAEYDYEGEPGT